MVSFFHWLAWFLTPNELTLLGVLSSGMFTLVTVIGTSIFALFIAFRQISKQFEHKIIYEGWKELQKNLFKFSSALVEFDTQIQWLTYFINSQDNPLVNGGSVAKHRLQKYQEVTNAYIKLQTAYVEFLKSFENNEIIFLSLTKMKTSFQEEYRKRTDDVYHDFMSKIFYDQFGEKQILNDNDMIIIINKYWMSLSEISAFIDDFRRELQNLTTGLILKKHIPKRIPKITSSILTRKGFKLIMIKK